METRKAEARITEKAFEIYPFNDGHYTIVSLGNKEVSAALNRRFKKYELGTRFQEGEEPFFLVKAENLYEALRILSPWR